MPWHLSKSDSRKVYDERHNTVCVCENSVYSRIIVEAVNVAEISRKETIANKPTDQGSAGGEQLHAHGVSPATIRLKEPLPMAPVDAFAPDDCCGKLIIKASRDGVLRSVTAWQCPKCGEEWKPETRFANGAAFPYRYWTMHPATAILRL